MRWFAKIFKQEGIQFDTAVSASGRGNIWARIKGGNQPALMLLHHMDVVPPDPKYWDVDPSVEAKWKDGFNNPARLISDRNTLMELQIEHAAFAELLRNMCSITMLPASNKINVIPPEAQAQVDCRLFPDQDRGAFLREFAAAINDQTSRSSRLSRSGLQSHRQRLRCTGR